MNQYNNNYTYVKHYENSLRLYNNGVSGEDIAYSELQIGLCEFIDKYNLKIFYFMCSPLTSHKLTLKTEVQPYLIKDNCVDFSDPNFDLISDNQSDDFMYIYTNNLCEVFYSFPMLTDNNFYYFNFIMVVKPDFNLNSFYQHQFKSIVIESVDELNINKLTFDYIKTLYTKRVIINNNYGWNPDHKKYYDLYKVSYPKSFYEEHEDKSPEFRLNTYQNLNSFYFAEHIDELQYTKNIFGLLTTHIWIVDRIPHIELNPYGKRLNFKEKYKLNSTFLVPLDEQVGFHMIDMSKHSENNNDWISYESIWPSCLYDGIHTDNIYISSLYKPDIVFNEDLYKTLPVIKIKEY